MFSTISTTLIPTLLKLISIATGCLGLGFLIAFHELGHFLLAKLFGVRTPSFSIGFGPKIFSKKIGLTEFSLSAIPFGGYVEMAGAAEVGQGEQKEAYATDEGSFAKKPFYQKFCILIGGILFNLLFAYCTMIILFMTGIPKNNFMNPTPVIAKITTNSATKQHGLQIGDRIIAIQNEPIDNKVARIPEILSSSTQTELNITIERDNTQKTLTIPLETTNQQTITLNTLGIVAFETEATPPHSFVQAISKGVGTTNTWIIATIKGFSQLFSKKGMQQVTGPIGIITMTTHAASTSMVLLLLFLVLISINLAILNLIPLPILDGGQILFYSIEALIGRSIPEKTREYIHIITWILFLLLFMYLSGKDIYNIVSPYISNIQKTI